jgi:hypothetical protein
MRDLEDNAAQLIQFLHGGDTFSRELTVGSPGYADSCVLDLGGPTTVALLATVTASDPDGLEWGEGEGQIAGDSDPQGVPRISLDGDTFSAAVCHSFPFYFGEELPFKWFMDAIAVPRFLQVGVGIFVAGGPARPEGSEHPSLAVQVDVVARSAAKWL